MDLELAELEKKIALLVEVVHQLRSENRFLRQQIAAKTDDVKRLSEKIETAKGRLETVLSRIPAKAV
jgi:cell division protein ZapB